MTIKEAIETAIKKGFTRITRPTIKKLVGHELSEAEDVELCDELDNLKRLKQKEAEKNQPFVTSFHVYVNWVKNPTWGLNPNAKVYVYYEGGSYDEFKYKVSGSGYDKLAAVLSGLLNMFLLRPLWENKKFIKKRIDGEEYVNWNCNDIDEIKYTLDEIGYKVNYVSTEREDIFEVKLKQS